MGTCLLVKCFGIGKKRSLFFILMIVILLLPGCSAEVEKTDQSSNTSMLPQTIKLPEPKVRGEISLEQTLQERRSVRDFSESALTIKEVSQLLWAAQGITSEWGGRTAPSAGGLYPLEVYLIAGYVEGLAAGSYRYNPEGHELTKVRDGDLRERLASASLDQTWVKESAINIIISAVYERTTGKYGERGIRYVHMEAGHSAQNIYLQATALDLGMVTIGAFQDDQVKEITGMMENETPLYVIPVGMKKE
jgi:SagB-type dehydrogenase family enzyme